MSKFVELKFENRKEIGLRDEEKKGGKNVGFNFNSSRTPRLFRQNLEHFDQILLVILLIFKKEKRNLFVQQLQEIKKW